MKIYSVLGSRV